MQQSMHNITTTSNEVEYIMMSFHNELQAPMAKN